MTPEEKAKAYDKAIKKAAALYKASESMSGCNVIIETLFPELAESEDEKIRKWIIDDIRFNMNNEPLNNSEYRKKAEKAIAWLEKQGTSYTKRDVNDAYLKGVTDTKNEIEKQYEANYQIRKDIATFIFNYRGDIKDRAKWINYLGIKVSFVEKQDEQPRYSIGDVLCDKSCTTLDKESQPNLEIIDIKDGMYICDKGSFPISQQDEYELVAKKVEQKSADEAEPKFKVGDWIINPRTGLIKHIKNVLLCDNNGNYEFESSSMSIDSVDNSFHLWTIQDAKDGDVLVTRKKQPFIFKNYDEDTDYIYAYCGICDLVKDNSFYADDDQLWTCYSVAGDVYPATKEQCDLLFREMKEAGYEWDDKNKELKKIEKKPSDETPYPETLEKAIDLYYYSYGNGKGEFEHLSLEKFKDIVYTFVSNYGQKPVEWNEEDERMYKGLHNLIYSTPYCDSRKELSDFLDSLKNRVQSKQEWSDVDKDILSRIIDDLKFLRDTVSIDPKYAVSIIDMEREITWLNSLKPQNKWKPSDEQMEALDWQVENTSVSSWQYKATKELMEDLKKLKEDKYG